MNYGASTHFNTPEYESYTINRSVYTVPEILQIVRYYEFGLYYCVHITYI
jgi:hypothetical protein